MQTRGARLRTASGQGVFSRAVPETIIAGSTFCIADDRGDIDVPPAGLFAHDTRFLSRFVLLVNGARPELLTGRRGDPHAASYFSRNPLAGGLEHDELEIVRRRRISVGLEEQLIVRNLGARRVELEVELELAADFADIFAVKAHDFSLGDAIDMTPLPGPAPAEYDSDARELRFADTASDLVTVVTFSQLGRHTEHGLGFHVSLAPHAEWELDLQFAAGLSAAEAEAAVVALPAEARRVEASLSAWRQTVPEASRRAWPCCSVRTTGRSTISPRSGCGRAATWDACPAQECRGSSTAFGRDTIITRRQTPRSAQSSPAARWRRSPRSRPREDDPVDRRRAGQDPPRAPPRTRHADAWLSPPRRHRRRHAALPRAPLANYRRWTRRRCARLPTHREPGLARARLDRRLGRRDGDGFVEYERRSRTGLENQSWKDSGDSQRFPDGRPREPDRTRRGAGYVYDAKRRLAELARDAWDDRALADELEEAAALAEPSTRILDDRARRGQYALALDPEGRAVDALSSNVGHLLWSGIVPEDRVAALVDSSRLRALERLGYPDDGRRPAAVQPARYHNGTVWPHDTSLDRLGACARRASSGSCSRAGPCSTRGRAPSRLPEAFAG